MIRRSGSEGVSFEADSDYWKLQPGDDYVGLLQKITEVLPPGMTLFVENTRSPLVASYLRDRPAEEPLAVASGSRWSRPDFYHMPMTVENIAGLAELMNRVAAPEVGDHLHVYRETTAFLIWYDYPDSPLYLRKDVTEDAVQELCYELGGEYTTC